MIPASHSLPGCFEKVVPVPVASDDPAVAPVHGRSWRIGLPALLRGSLNALWTSLHRQGHGLALRPGRQRRLRVSETLSLGEKRFLSLIEVDGQSFLLGGSSTQITLLATLTHNPDKASFQQVLKASTTQNEAR